MHRGLAVEWGVRVQRQRPIRGSVRFAQDDREKPVVAAARANEDADPLRG